MAGPAFYLGTTGEAATLAFGPTPQGTSLGFYLVIFNQGTTPLVITAVTVTADPGTPTTDFKVLFFTGSLTIAPGAEDTSLALLFQPTAAPETFESAQLQFTSNSVYGVDQFQVTGTCAVLPTSSSATPTPTSCTSTTSISSGTATNYSTSVAFPSTPVGSGASVTVTYSYSGNASTIGNAQGQAFVQFSTDGGTTWQTTGGGWTGNSTASFSGPGTISLGTLLTNLSQLQVRAATSVTVYPSGNPMNVSITLSGFTATMSTGGDTFVEVSQFAANNVLTFPIQNMGPIALGSPTTTSTFNIYNPTSAPVTVTFTFAPEYSLGTVSGANPMPAGGTLHVTFIVTPQRKGPQDDPAAVTVQAQGSSFSTDIEIQYQTPVLVSAYSLTGNREATVLALGSHVSVAIPFYFDSGTPCEDQCTLGRYYYFDQPQLNKNVNRVWMIYERLGTVVLDLAMGTTNPKNSANPVAQVTLPTTNDGIPDILVFDIQLTGSMLALVFRPELQGTLAPLSIVGFVVKVEEGGEVIEGT